jgi:hypothetical protein
MPNLPNIDKPERRIECEDALREKGLVCPLDEAAGVVQGVEKGCYRVHEA